MWISSTMVSYLPVQIGNNGEGWSWEGKDPNFKPLVTEWESDEDLIETIGAEVVEGDFLSKNQEGIVINKTFADIIGWKSFAGKILSGYGTPHRIAGVIKDIRYNSLSTETMPMVLQMSDNSRMSYLLIKVNTNNITSTIDYIRKNL